MTEIEFFLKLFPQTYETTNKDVFVNFDDDEFHFVRDIEELNVSTW